MTRFNEVIPKIAEILEAHLGPDKLHRATIVRDAMGQATIVLPDDLLDQLRGSSIAAQLHEALGVFSAGRDQILLGERDLIDPGDVVDSPDRIARPEHGGLFLVDRQLSNQDWLRKPHQTESPLPVGVGFSIKGGVGRSTALAILAWQLARLGKRVVVVDLDLPAPGIGSLLLPIEQSPDFGLVDWLMQSLVGGATSDVLGDCLGQSTVADDAPGSVLVMPAFGRKTTEYVAKLGRVHQPTLDSRGELIGTPHRLAKLLTELSERFEPPDVVLLDARAGLDDMGAAAVTQLGAEVFLFGRDDAQGWAAYRRLFDHLRLSQGIAYGMPDSDLRLRMKMVAAQLDPSEEAFMRFVDTSYTAWQDLYDDEDSYKEGGPLPKTFPANDVDAPHHALPIYFGAAFRTLDLSQVGRRPSWSVVEAAFHGFLEGCVERLVDDEPSQGSS